MHITLTWRLQNHFHPYFQILIHGKRGRFTWSHLWHYLPNKSTQLKQDECYCKLSTPRSLWISLYCKILLRLPLRCMSIFQLNPLLLCFLQYGYVFLLSKSLTIRVFFMEFAACNLCYLFTPWDMRGGLSTFTWLVLFLCPIFFVPSSIYVTWAYCV